MAESESKIGKMHLNNRNVSYLWVNYVAGAILGAEAATNEWFDSSKWTLMIPATILLVTIFWNEGGDQFNQSD